MEIRDLPTFLNNRLGRRMKPYLYMGIRQGGTYDLFTLVSKNQGFTGLSNTIDIFQQKIEAFDMWQKSYQLWQNLGNIIRNDIKYELLKSILQRKVL
jgi:hypothetical protein